MKKIKESLYEFSKRGNDLPQDDVNTEYEDIEYDVDTVEDEISNDVFDDDLSKTLNNEIKIPEFNRRVINFRLKGQSEPMSGIPMAKLGAEAFLFKLDNGIMKKIYLRDMITESNNNNRAKLINEDFDDFDDEYDDEFNEDLENIIYTLTDGRTVTLAEENFPGMAGEPVYIHIFIDTDTNEKLSFNDIEHLLEDEDLIEIRELLDEDSESNASTAKNWVE